MANWPADRCCAALVPHIIGSAFSLLLASNETPVDEGGIPVANPSTWGVAVELVAASGANIAIVGAWVHTGEIVLGSPVWSMRFEQNDTSAWPKGERIVRLIYTAPDARVFKQDTDMMLEIKR